jgi:hypothetical protein
LEDRQPAEHYRFYPASVSDSPEFVEHLRRDWFMASASSQQGAMIGDNQKVTGKPYVCRHLAIS